MARKNLIRVPATQTITLTVSNLDTIVIGSSAGILVKSISNLEVKTRLQMTKVLQTDMNQQTSKKRTIQLLNNDGIYAEYHENYGIPMARVLGGTIGIGDHVLATVKEINEQEGWVKFYVRTPIGIKVQLLSKLLQQGE